MAIGTFERQYMSIIKDIEENGYRCENNRTGIGTRRKANVVFSVDLSKELPIIRSKKTYWKNAVDEALWIYQKGSNDVSELRSHIWDAWADENGTIKKGYGYQISKHDQVRRILTELEKDPSTRRAVIDLWQCEDLNEMTLTPCVYTHVWNIIDGKLNVSILQRSCDILVGGVFNILQFAVLNHLFARHLGVTPGNMTFMWSDCHIYENQIEALQEWKFQYETMCQINNSWIPVDRVKDQLGMDKLNEAGKAVVSNPSLWINPEKKDFWDITLDDIDVKDYWSMPSVHFPVAV